MPPKSEARISLANVLCNESEPPYSLDDFIGFLKKEHSDENLDFWTAIVNYRQLALPYFPNPGRTRGSKGSLLEGYGSSASLSGTGSTSSLSDDRDKDKLDPEVKAKLKQELDLIVTLYLTPGGSREVNLGDQVRKKVVRDIVEKKILHPDLFKVAAEKIFELMRLDSFNRFVNKVNQASVKSGLPTYQVDREGGARSAINALQKHSQNTGRTAAI